MEENFNIHLGKKLRMRRLSLGLTQTKVAQAINVTFQQIQKYEKGTNKVPIDKLIMIAERTKRDILWFFPHDKRPIGTAYMGTPTKEIDEGYHIDIDKESQ